MQINKFLGGLDTDAHPSQQKEHTVRYGLNFIPMSEEGNLYSITNESGTELMSDVKFPTGFKPIGHTILNNDIIVILCDDANNSQVGYIVEDDSPDVTTGFYHASGPVDAAGNPLTNNSELGFKQIHPVDCVSRKLINGHRLLYFTDNNVPYGYFDLDNPPIEGSVEASVKLTFDQKIPKINVIEIIEGAFSSIRPGVVQFITRYVTLNGDTTVFGLPSEVFPIVSSSKSEGVSKYQGAFYEDGIVNKNLIVRFTNVDVLYQELEIVALYYESSSSVFNASIVGQVPIVNDTIDFTYTGPDTENLISLTRSELQQVVVSYTHAKCIEQKDNTLFLSNLRDERVELAEQIQKVANKVRVKYVINNIKYSGRGNNSESNLLGFVNSEPPYISGLFTVNLTMNQNVAPDSGNQPANYQLIRNGQSAAASITIVDYALLAPGDTITIAAPTSPPYTGSQVAIVITAIAAGGIPTANEFEIGTDNNSTTTNIFTTLNNLTTSTITEFTIQSDPTIFGVINLLWNDVDVNVNTTVVTSSNTTAITTTDFTGANTTVSTINAVSATVSENQCNINFGVVIRAGDELIVTSPGIYLESDATDLSGDSFFTTGLTDGLEIIENITDPTVAVSSVPGFTDYTSEFLTASTKGYRRGEVYSLGFKVLWKDGSMSNAFHIPGYNGYTTANVKGKVVPTGTDVWPTINDGNVGVPITGYVGTYVSEDFYTLDQGYPGNDINDDLSEVGPAGIERNIRHHYMPNLEAQPHFTNIDDEEFIRVLGLEFEFTQSFSPEVLAQAEEIIFLRERRNTDNNKSVHSQGVVHKHMILSSSNNNDGYPDGSAIIGEPNGSPYSNMKSSYFLAEIPFFNLSMNIYFTNNFEQNGASTRRGIVSPQFHQDIPGASYAAGNRFRTEVIRNQVMFHSPESNLLSGFKLNAEDIKGYSLVQELQMIGRIQAANIAKDKQKSETGAFIANRHKISRFGYLDLYCNYNEVRAAVASTNNHVINDARYLEPNINRIDSIDPNHPALKVSTEWSAGGLQLFLDSNVISTADQDGIGSTPENGGDYQAIKIVNTYNPNINFDVDKDVSRYYLQQGSITDPEFSDTTSNNKLNKRSLYNITVNNSKQYGQINNASYIPIKRNSIKDVSDNFISTYTQVYGGDTFITKYAFNAGVMVPWSPFFDDGRYPINQLGETKTQRPGGYENIGNDSKVDGLDFRTCTFYFVESNINTHYRHRPEDETKQDYFPNELDISKLLNNWYPYLENIKAYNTQYSYENNIIESFVAGSTNVTVSEFENRTIYSEQAAEDDTLDTYRSFLVNDFYDLPSEKGPIWDTFVEFNVLFMHTPKALWQTFAEGQATIKGSNISDAVLGISRLFARPAQEVLETDGGYGGSISQFGGAHTQLGYIFADVLQGKIFLIGSSKKTGVILKEISKEGISTEMHETLSLGITKVDGRTDLTNVTTRKSHLIDNPYLGIGIVSGYDYKLNRYLITKFPVDGQTNGFTLSYAKDIAKWFNYHSYMPNIYISYNNRFLFVDNKTTTSQFHEMNIGPKGSYFGTVYDSELTFVVTTKGQTCTFNNIVINSVSKDRTTNIKQRDDNFYEMSAHNQMSNTGQYTMKPSNTFGVTIAAGEVSVKYRNNEYRMVIPRDSVIDNSIDLFDAANLDNMAKFRERIKGDYIIVNLKYDNTKNLEFVLNFLKSIFTNNFR